jgi:hypothetical protein
MHPSDISSGDPVTSTSNLKDLFKSKKTHTPVSQQSGDCTDHRALDARGLVAQFISSELQRLHRPPSTRRSGTGRPVCQLRTSRITPTTEHSTLGDWSLSLSVQNFKGLHRPPSTRRSGTGRLVYQFKTLKHAPTTEHSMLGDWSYSIATYNSKKHTKCLGTGRLVFSIADEHDMLGDW